MKKYTKIMAIILASMMLVVLLAACGGDDAPANDYQEAVTLPAEIEPEPELPPLVMATNAEFPPFEFINDYGEYDGFDVDFANAIADRLGRELIINNMAFDAIIAAVIEGDGNMVGIAAITDTAERRESVDFTDSYFQTELVVIVLQDSPINSPDDLDVHSVAVQAGTTSDLMTDWFLPDANIIRLPAAPSTVLELQSGRADAIIIDRGVAEQFLSENPDLRILDEPLTEEFYAIVVQKGNPELLADLNRVIRELKEDGTFQQLYDKWFGG